MNLTHKDIGTAFKIRDRGGEPLLRALSADGKTAFIDLYPEAFNNFKGRYASVPVGDVLRRVRPLEEPTRPQKEVSR